MVKEEKPPEKPADKPAVSVSPPPGARADSSGGADVQTVDHWAEVFYPPTSSGRQHAKRWQHAKAAADHHWAAAVHHTGEVKKLSRADYLGAIKASTTPDAKGRFTPHQPALYEVAK